MQEKIKNIALPVGFGVLFIVIWQIGLIHLALGFEKYQLPLPLDILNIFQDRFIEKILPDTITTISASLVGMIFGSFIGYIVAVIATMLPKWGYTGLTVISAFNAIPIVALSPIMNRWFDSGFLQKVGVVTIVCMAAMAINAYRGLNDLKEFSVDLLDSYAAPKKVILFKLRLPNSMPSVLTALKINVSGALMAAMISEYFATSTVGIGFGIKDNLRKGNMALGWSYIVVSALVGIIIYLLIVMVERKVIKWHASQR